MLRLEIDNRGQVCVVELAGRLDGSPSCASVKETVRNAIDEGHLHFVFDLSDVVSLSSAGIGCLVRTYSKIQEKGGTMHLRGLNERVRHTLEVTRLIPEVFAVDEDGMEARG